jgi:hypothetical protein
MLSKMDNLQMNVIYVYCTFSMKAFACFGLGNGVTKENFVPCANHIIDNARDDKKPISMNFHHFKVVILAT